MDKKSGILLIVLLLLIIVSIYLTYERSFITKDYEVLISEEEGQTIDEDGSQGIDVEPEGGELVQ